GLNHYRSKCQPMTTEVTISLAQIDCRIADPETNFARAATLVAEAARRGSDLVILPELWSTAYALDQAAALSSPLAQTPADGGWFGRVAQMAADNGLFVAGSLLEARASRFFNCLAVYGPDGTLAGAYRKMHLFRLMDEEKYL